MIFLHTQKPYILSTHGCSEGMIYHSPLEEELQKSSHRRRLMRWGDFSSRREEGAVLVVSLIILLVLTLIAISALQSSLVEQKISFSYQDVNIALQGADAAQRQVETLIDGLVDTSGFTNQNGLYESGQAPEPYLASTWTGTVSSVVTLPNFGADAPRYFIERVQTLENGAMSLNIYNYGQNPQPGSVTLFRIVTYSTGRSGDAQTIVQTFYARTF